MTKAGELRIISMIRGVKKIVENGGAMMSLVNKPGGISNVNWMLQHLSLGGYNP